MVSDTFILANYQVINPVAYNDTSVCTGQPVQLTGDAGYQSYNWTGNLQGQTITITIAGNYSFTAVDANGCNVQSNTVTITNRPYPNAVITATPPAICVGSGTST